MKKTFSRLQLFSIVDGRLSCDIGDVYLMMNHICDDNLFTHHLPVAKDYLVSKNPQWFKDETEAINRIKESLRSDNFKVIYQHLKDYPLDIEVPQLKDEFDTSDFSGYMINNSLLLKL